ncbi:MAG: cadmium resistance transporter [Elainella sp. C42_A2020_010]|nr:cadmium resistance transporter [Elainella sp. C42_A2020_010]
MNWLIGALVTGIAVAFATTFDDNIYLTLFFGKVNRFFRPRHVVVGEFLGFTALVAISLVGFLGGLAIPPIWIGLLGFLPVMIGISHLLSREPEETIQTVSASLDTKPTFGRPSHPKQTLWETIRDPQTYRVSAVTIANGGNNVGIYIPLFASSTLPNLAVILVVCYLTVGVWCFMSYHLTRQPAIAFVMARYARKIFPFVLIWLGFSIVIENQSYRLLLPI